MIKMIDGTGKTAEQIKKEVFDLLIQLENDVDVDADTQGDSSIPYGTSTVYEIYFEVETFQINNVDDPELLQDLYTHKFSKFIPTRYDEIEIECEFEAEIDFDEEKRDQLFRVTLKT